MSALIGQIIGDYRIVASAGARANGEAFVARHHLTDREVLLHVCHLQSDRSGNASLSDIGRRLAHIQHVGIPQILAGGTHTARSVEYLVMERPRGRSVGDVLRVEGPPPDDALNALAVVVANAIMAAQANGVVLHELPALDSIIVDAVEPSRPWYDVQVVLSDWSLARLERSWSLADGAVEAGVTELARGCDATELAAAFVKVVLEDAASGIKEGASSNHQRRAVGSDDDVNIASFVSNRLGQLLLQLGLLTTEDLDTALQVQVNNPHQRLDLTIVMLGLVPEAEVVSILARQFQMPFIDLPKFELDTRLLKLVPAAFASKHTVLPLKREGRSLFVAIADPSATQVIEDLKFITRYDIIPVLAGEFSLRATVEKHYGDDESENHMPSLLRESSRDEESEILMPSLLRESPGDDDVQFTCYSPNRLVPERFHSLLVFAHKGTPVALEDGTMFDPVAEVEAQAQGVLGAQRAAYRSTVQESREAIPHAGLLTFALELPSGMTGNPLTQSVQWLEPVHRVEFRVKADASLDGTTARGRVLVYLGAIMIAEIALRFAIAVSPTADGSGEARAPVSARRYRRIFASYSRHDAAVVEQFSAYAEAMGDRYLKDVVSLRAGERWGEGLQALIREADVFQLFWSSRAMESPFVRQEWEFALSLGRDGFVRPCYWEMPLPQRPPDLPPPPLQALHFQALRIGPTTHSADLASESVEAPPQISTPRVAVQTFPRSPIHPVDPSAPPPSEFSPTTAEDTGEPTQAQHSGGPQPSTVMLVLGTMLLVVLIAAAVLAVR